MKMVRWEMRSPNEPLVRVETTAPDPAPGEVLLQVAGCGVCHTDLGFFDGSVRTNHPLPLALGHEVSGTIVGVGDGVDARAWLGRAVIVPAVIPCGACSLCRKGRGSICRRQIFLGNDIPGGFATHVMAPARGLCPVPAASRVDVADLSVLADAVTTAYQAVRRAAVGPGDLAIVVGTGGVGGFAVQVAAALGATVAALDVDEERLKLMASHGASLALNPSAMDAKAMRSALRSFAKERRLPEVEWKIFETSGTAAGQDLAFRLLTHGSHLSIVGYTTSEVTVRLSNLMALDATAAGNWGCLPALYPEALAMILSGNVVLGPFVERWPLSRVNDVLTAFREKKIRKRAILVPDGGA